MKNLLLENNATQTTSVQPRIPAPKNITEIGGYINLLRELDQEQMLRQVLASVLGITMPKK
ncbi:MAG: hypothetical protein Q4D14_00215 [Bacteroidales bacterium]|nr:hypothetical protein [Bacteroidales bacterium]